MKVLFVGNSHTFFNDMPELFARFAQITTGEKPFAAMLAYPGRDLDWHLNEYYSLRFNLLHGGYDFCVIQQAAHPYPPAEKTLYAGAKIIDLCHRCGTRPVVFMTWAEKRFPQNQQKMIDTCEILAKQNDALLAPIGRVWQRVCETRPDIELYGADGEHAGPYGDFLAAAVLCRCMMGSVSEKVSGLGFQFLKDPSHHRPVREDKALLPEKLDREKTDHILKVIADCCARAL